MLFSLLNFGFFKKDPPSSTASSTSPLLCLPREIRDLIYDHVFETESTLVCLKPALDPATAITTLRLCTYSPVGRHKIIDLFLIEVCADINQECKDFLWSHKTLVINPADPSIRSKYFKSVRSVRLDLDLGCGTYPAWTRECFAYLEKWAEDGKFKKLDLSIVRCRESLYCVAEVREAKKIGWVSCRNIRRDKVVGRWEEYLEILKEYGTNTEMPKLGRTVTRTSVDVGWNDITRSHQEQLLSLAGTGNVRGICMDVQAAFGGELWQDGTLCWKNGEQVNEVFQLKEDARSCGGTG